MKTIPRILRSLHIHKKIIGPMFAALLIAHADAQSRPAITRINPEQGPTTKMVTIRGTNFDRDNNGNLWTGTPPYTVQFGSSGDVTPTFVSSTKLKVAVPNNATTGPVRLRTFGLSQTVITQSAGNFTVTQVTRPAITGFSPASASPGTEITIDGTNFHLSSVGIPWTGAPTYRVQFFTANGPIEVVPTFVSNNRIRVVVPTLATFGQSPLRLSQNKVTFNSSNTVFTVTQPTTLRIVNNSQYNIVSLTVNGVEEFAFGSGVLAGNTVNLNSSPGTKSLVAGLGFLNADGTRDILFNISRSLNITAGTVGTMTVSRITVGQLLTMGSSGGSTNWVGSFFDNNGAFHEARFRFNANGTWQFFVDGVQNGSGSLREISWPNSAVTVGFSVNTALPNIEISRPFGSFFFRNGPASFPIIQYVRQ